MDTLRQQLSEERNKREELEATLRERNAELGDCESAAKRREDKLQSKYDSLKRTLESLQQSRAEEEQRNKQLRDEIESLRSERARMTADHSRLEQKLDATKQGKQDAVDEAKNLTVRLRECEEREDKARAGERAAQRDVAELRQAAEQREAGDSSLRAENAALFASVQDLAQMCDAAEAREGNANAINVHTSQKLAALELKFRAETQRNATFRTLAQNITNAEAQLRSLREHLVLPSEHHQGSDGDVVGEAEELLGVARSRPSGRSAGADDGPSAAAQIAMRHRLRESPTKLEASSAPAKSLSVVDLDAAKPETEVVTAKIAPPKPAKSAKPAKAVILAASEISDRGAAAHRDGDDGEVGSS